MITPLHQLDDDLSNPDQTSNSSLASINYQSQVTSHQFTNKLKLSNPTHRFPCPSELLGDQESFFQPVQHSQLNSNLGNPQQIISILANKEHVLTEEVRSLSQVIEELVRNLSYLSHKYLNLRESYSQLQLKSQSQTFQCNYCKQKLSEKSDLSKGESQQEYNHSNYRTYENIELINDSSKKKDICEQYKYFYKLKHPKSQNEDHFSEETKQQQYSKDNTSSIKSNNNLELIINPVLNKLYQHRESIQLSENSFNISESHLEILEDKQNQFQDISKIRIPLVDKNGDQYSNTNNIFQQNDRRKLDSDSNKQKLEKNLEFSNGISTDEVNNLSKDNLINLNSSKFISIMKTFEMVKDLLKFEECEFTKAQKESLSLCQNQTASILETLSPSKQIIIPQLINTQFFPHSIPFLLKN